MNPNFFLYRIWLTLVLFFAGLAFANTQTLLYTEDFASGATPAGWTIVNGGSGNNWAVSATNPFNDSYNLRYAYHTSNAANSWAFTKAIPMVAGRTYYVEFYQRVRLSSYTEKLKVTVGNAQTIVSQTTVLYDNNSLTNTAYTNRVSSNFVAPSTGNFYFSFNCYSAANMYDLNIDNVRIYEVAAACTPPTTAASGLSFSGIGTNSMTVSWARGNGDNVLVVMKASGNPANPVNGSSYTANSVFGSGTDLGSSSYAVYKGTGTSVAVSGLSSGVTYTVEAWEFKNTGPCYIGTMATADATTLGGSVSPTNDCSSLGHIGTLTAGNCTVIGTGSFPSGSISVNTSSATLSGTTPVPSCTWTPANNPVDVWFRFKTGVATTGISVYSQNPSYTSTTDDAGVSIQIYRADNNSDCSFAAGDLVTCGSVLWGWDPDLYPAYLNRINVAANTEYVVRVFVENTTVETKNLLFDLVIIPLPAAPANSNCASGASNYCNYGAPEGHWGNDLDAPSWIVSCQNTDAFYSLDNPVYIPVIASSTNFSLTLDNLTCNTGSLGEMGQLALFSSCDAIRTSGTGMDTVYSNPNRFFGCAMGSGTVTLNATIPAGMIGKPLVLVVDGDGGVNCTWTMSATGASLPVDLVSFYGKCFGNFVRLRWATSSEINNDYFVVERSYDALNFTQIGIVNGSGTTGFRTEYLFDDDGMNHSQGIIYYRIKQVDADGKYEYSMYAPVDCSKEIDPVSLGVSEEELDLIFKLDDARNIRVTVHNTLGQVVYQQRFVTEGEGWELSIPKHMLGRGIFLINIEGLPELWSGKILID